MEQHALVRVHVRAVQRQQLVYGAVGLEAVLVRLLLSLDVLGQGLDRFVVFEAMADDEDPQSLRGRAEPLGVGDVPAHAVLLLLHGVQHHLEMLGSLKHKAGNVLSHHECGPERDRCGEAQSGHLESHVVRLLVRVAHGGGLARDAEEYHVYSVLGDHR